MNFVVITPARNEEAFIAATAESVASQTVRPSRWVVIDDGSSDRTAEIIENFAMRYDWITVVRRPARADRNFAGKVMAFNAGLEQVRESSYELVANLDADVVLQADHFEFLIERFCEDPKLGVAGTAYYQGGTDSTRDSFEGEESVAGPLQFFRRECFEEIGGYVPNPMGGVDWIAVTTARLKGWRTRNFPQRKFLHQRYMGTAARGRIGAMFDYGKKDYFLGRSPLWQVFRAIYRSFRRPFLGGIALFFGYVWGALKQTERAVSPELMRFHRREQMTKLRNIIISLLHLRPIERFYLPGKRG